MKDRYYFNTGLNGKDAIEASMKYDKNAGGYVARFLVGDRATGGYFGWHIDADFFRFYQRNDTVLLVPAARRSAKKEAEALEKFNALALELVLAFAEKCEEIGAPHMTITAA